MKVSHPWWDSHTRFKVKGHGHKLTLSVRLVSASFWFRKQNAVSVSFEACVGIPCRPNPAATLLVFTEDSRPTKWDICTAVYYRCCLTQGNRPRNCLTVQNFVRITQGFAWPAGIAMTFRWCIFISSYSRLHPLTSSWPHLRCDVGLEEDEYY